MSHRSLSPRNPSVGGLGFTAPFGSLHNQMNGLWQSVFGTPSSADTAGRRLLAPAFTPRVDVAVNDTCVTITAELPGVLQKDVEVTVVDDLLVLRGEKNLEERSESDDVYHVERSHGSFERRVALPAEVLTDEAAATFEDGVLSVVLPRSKGPEERCKKIEVTRK